MAARLRFGITYWLLVCVLLTVAVIVRSIDPAPIAKLRLQIFDAYQQLAPRAFDPELPVRIVDIDDKSLRTVGQWPWPRSTVAKLTSKLAEAGAAVVGFDVVMSESDRLSVREALRRLPPSPALDTIVAEVEAMPTGDAEFADVIGQSSVVLGFIGVGNSDGQVPKQLAGFASAGNDPRLFVPRFPSAITSLETIQGRAKGTGALNWVPEHDQVIRRLPLVVSVGDTLLPSFAAELLRLGQGASTYVVKASGASGEEAFGRRTGLTQVRIGRIDVPTDAAGQLWLHFTKSDRRRFISAADVLAGTVPGSDIDGRIILIGTSAAGLFDLRTTPLDASISGVEVHAQAIEQMLTGFFLQRPDFASGAEIALMVGAGLLLATVLYLTGAKWSAILGAGILAAALSSSWALYFSHGWLLDPLYGAMTVTALYIVGTAYLYFRAEAERNQVRNAFSRYLAPSLVEELAANPERLRLGGEMRIVTLMFADVRSFTSIAEKLDAEQLTQLVNQLLTPLSKAVLAHRGTIDKYMGDAVMAFWNAPLADAEHQRNAALAALSMLQGLDALNGQRKALAETSGAAFVPIRLGIGINTAECCVGNLGSEDRFDYSVIGDGVNLASRLEGLSKLYGFPIIVGESTVSAARDLAFLEIDYTAVLGRTEPSKVYALLGDAAMRKTERFKELEALQNKMLAAFRSQAFDEAQSHLRSMSALGRTDLSTLVALYGERIDRFRATPPPGDWDGSVAAETK